TMGFAKCWSAITFRRAFITPQHFDIILPCPKALRILERDAEKCARFSGTILIYSHVPGTRSCERLRSYLAASRWRQGAVIEVNRRRLSARSFGNDLGNGGGNCEDVDRDPGGDNLRIF